jgi:hypothetical protein
MNKLKIVISVFALVALACVCTSTAPGVTPQPIETQGGSASQPAAAPSEGSSRDNPYPVGTAVDVGSNMLITVGTVTRPADKKVQQYNEFNDTPEPTLEYMQVEIQAKCTKPASDTCSLILASIKAVGADGQVHDPALVAGIPNELDTTTEFFGGSTKTGNLMFLVPKGDQTVVLIVEVLLSPNIYLAVK